MEPENTPRTRGGLKNEYTMAEFIKEFGLGVSLNDPAATRAIAKRLTQLGYVKRFARRGGNSRPVWVRGNPTMEALHEKLKAIK